MLYINIITFLIFLVAGSLPALLAHYLLRAPLLGGPWIGSLVGLIGAVVGSLADSLMLPRLPDILPVGGAADIVPPVIGSVVFVALYALVSASNRSDREDAKD